MSLHCTQFHECFHILDSLKKYYYLWFFICSLIYAPSKNQPDCTSASVCSTAGSKFRMNSMSYSYIMEVPWWCASPPWSTLNLKCHWNQNWCFKFFHPPHAFLSLSVRFLGSALESFYWSSRRDNSFMIAEATASPTWLKFKKKV